MPVPEQEPSYHADPVYKEVRRPVSLQSSTYWWVFPLLMMAAVLMATFDGLSRARVEKVIKSAPIVAPKDIKSYCNTGKVIITRLYTNSEGIGGKDACFSYIELSQQMLVSKHYEWQKIASAPATVQLFDQDKSVEVKLNENDFNLGAFPITFEDTGSQRFKSKAPASWQSQMDEPDKLYRLRTLPLGKKVQIAGTFWQTNDGIYVRGFTYKGLGNSQYSSDVYLAPFSE